MGCILSSSKRTPLVSEDAKSPPRIRSSVSITPRVDLQPALPVSTSTAVQAKARRRTDSTLPRRSKRRQHPTLVYGAGTSAQTRAMIHTPFFVALEESELKVFASFFKMRQFAPGVTLYRQGDLADAFYIIQQGQVDVSMTTPPTPSPRRDSDSTTTTTTTTTINEDGSTHLSYKGQGDFFGVEFVLDTHGESLRTHTITTMKPCVIMSLSREAFQDYLDSCSGEGIRNTIRNLCNTNLAHTLKKLEFLRDIPDDKLQLLGSMLRYVTLEAKHDLFLEGSLGTSMYIVAVGHLLCTVQDEQDDTVLLNEFRPGDFFGETGLMLSMPRTATISASERCLLLELSKKNFHNFLNLVPEFKKSFSAVAKQRTAASFRKYQVPFFEAIPDEKYAFLASLCKIEEIKAGQVVFEEGQNGSCFYMIAHGELSVQIEKEVESGETERKQLAIMHPGQYFGEIALVRDTPRQATVTALSRSVLLSITKDNFDVFFQEVPEAMADFQVKLARYNISLKHLIYHPQGLDFLTKYLETEYNEENIYFWKAAGDWRKLWVKRDRRKSSSVLDAVPRHKKSQSTVSPTLGQLDEDRRRFITKRATEILEKYVLEGAEFEVNINDESRASIQEQIANVSFTDELFVDAEQEVLTLIDVDSFRRFKQSHFFQDFLKITAAYDFDNDEAAARLSPTSE